MHITIVDMTVPNKVKLKHLDQPLAAGCSTGREDPPL